MKDFEEDDFEEDFAENIFDQDDKKLFDEQIESAGLCWSASWVWYP